MNAYSQETILVLDFESLGVNINALKSECNYKRSSINRITSTEFTNMEACAKPKPALSR